MWDRDPKDDRVALFLCVGDVKRDEHKGNHLVRNETRERVCGRVCSISEFPISQRGVAGNPSSSFNKTWNTLSRGA
jgi:hypothetical protein